MFTFLCAILCAAATADEPLDLRIQVEQALRRDALAEFSGTVSFIKGEARQSWEITTDGQGQIRAKIVLPHSDLKNPLYVGETHNQIWFAQETTLHVWNKPDTPEKELSGDGTFDIATTLINQARTSLRRIGGPRVMPGRPLEILLLEPGPESPAAVARYDGTVKRVELLSVAEDLLVSASLTSETAGMTSRWQFVDYHATEGRWIPRRMEYSQLEDGEIVDGARYDEIGLISAPRSATLRDRLASLETAQGQFEHLDLVQVYRLDGTRFRLEAAKAISRTDDPQ